MYQTWFLTIVAVWIRQVISGSSPSCCCSVWFFLMLRKFCGTIAMRVKNIFHRVFQRINKTAHSGLVLIVNFFRYGSVSITCYYCTTICYYVNSHAQRSIESLYSCISTALMFDFTFLVLGESGPSTRSSVLSFSSHFTFPNGPLLLITK